MRRENCGYILFFIICVCSAILYVVTAETQAAYKVLYPQKIDTPSKEEFVTGFCTFGDCPTGHKIPDRVIEIQEILKENQTVEVVKESLTTELVSETYTLSDEPVAKNATTEPVTDSHDYGYIGTFYITGYTAEEGFQEGSATASGYGVRPGYCAMNDSQRRSLGIRYGDQIYVDGLGIYTVMDCGCGWGVVDIWLYTDAEAYSITGNYDVYLI